MSDAPAHQSLWFRMGLPLVVVVVALVIGSGALSGQPQTNAQRAAAIGSVVRCPSCIDVSVEQSETTTALAVRHEIERLVAHGRSTTEIKQTLVSQYGPTILLVPGGFALIWIVPIVLGAAAVGVIGVLFWRRSRQFAATRSAQTVDAP